MDGDRILVFGGRTNPGWLAGKFVHAFKARHTTADICDSEQVRDALHAHKPEWVINAAGWGGDRNIDDCVASHTAILKTTNSNCYGPEILARICVESAVRLLHISSGCIYHHEGRHMPPLGFAEDDEPNPVSLYAQEKFMGERAVRAVHKESIVLRVRMPADSDPHPRNFITKLGNCTQLIDVTNSITLVPSLIGAAQVLIDHNEFGVYHTVNPTPVNYRGFADLYRIHVDGRYAPEFIPEHDLRERGLVRERRSTCTLNPTKLLQTLGRHGTGMASAPKGLEWLLQTYGDTVRRQAQ